MAIASAPAADRSPGSNRVLIIFSEGKDLPGNVVLEQAVRTELPKKSAEPTEFFTEHLDASRFSDETHYRIFRDYLASKYAGQDLDLVIIGMARDYKLAERLPVEIFPSVPILFLTSTELDPPAAFATNVTRGIIHRLDVKRTLELIPRLQPEIRKVVVIGGRSASDVKTLERIAVAARGVPGIQLEFWTNQPLSEVQVRAAALPRGTAIFLSTLFEDESGHTVYMSQAAQLLAPAANVPVYVLSPGGIGSGAVGGAVIDAAQLGAHVAELAAPFLSGNTRGTRSIQEWTGSSIILDWRALQRWGIPLDRAPAEATIRFRPLSLWEQHKILILSVSAVLLAQALTIAGLIVQSGRRRRAEAEILRQRGELAHVSRVSTMGQLASSLAHELNQPLGAILRNTEAAEIFLQKDQPNLAELRAILSDIRKDDQRAGQVIERMRSLLKRRSMEPKELDLRDLIAETIALAQPDAKTRRLRLVMDAAPQLPAVRGDRVQLQQVLLNLIINAMDAMGPASPGDGEVLVRAMGRQGGEVEVEVSDSGSGIPTERITQVFEPFFTTKPDGMGMGLAISRTIIEAHGGSVRAANNKSKGATVSFTLPAADKSER
jgi:C4-dicarboxylate-specific signal transduction histidine kinase